jgi:hypothetical protein
MDRFLVGSEYADHLTDADLGLLASVAAADTGTAADASSLRSDPVALLRLLEHPGAFRTVLGGTVLSGPGGTAPGQAVPASPFLVFAVSVQRAAAELASAGHVPERTGPRQRVPLFDAPALRDFLAAPARRLFLAELLASFTRVASGRYRARVGGRMRTRRFSELDPVRLAGLLEAVPPAERPGVYRRLGDVTLFLTGVFPDYATAHALGPVNAARLLRAAQPARLAAGPPRRLARHRVLGAPRYPLVPGRPRPGAGGHRADHRGRRGGRPLPAGPARAQPRRRPVPVPLGQSLVRATRLLARSKQARSRQARPRQARPKPAGTCWITRPPARRVARLADL